MDFENLLKDFSRTMQKESSVWTISDYRFKTKIVSG
jgi:hypothetical protein